MPSFFSLAPNVMPSSDLSTTNAEMPRAALLGIGHRHHRVVLADAGVGDPALHAVEHPVVAVADRAALHRGGVGARLRLGQAVGEATVPGGEPAEVVLLDLLGATDHDRQRAELVDRRDEAAAPCRPGRPPRSRSRWRGRRRRRRRTPRARAARGSRPAAVPSPPPRGSDSPRPPPRRTARPWPRTGRARPHGSRGARPRARTAGSRCSWRRFYFRVTATPEGALSRGQHSAQRGAGEPQQTRGHPRRSDRSSGAGRRWSRHPRTRRTPRDSGRGRARTRARRRPRTAHRGGSRHRDSRRPPGRRTRARRSWPPAAASARPSASSRYASAIRREGTPGDRHARRSRCPTITVVARDGDQELRPTGRDALVRAGPAGGRRASPCRPSRTRCRRRASPGAGGRATGSRAGPAAAPVPVALPGSANHTTAAQARQVTASATKSQRIPKPGSSAASTPATTPGPAIAAPRAEYAAAR